MFGAPFATGGALSVARRRGCLSEAPRSVPNFFPTEANMKIWLTLLLCLFLGVTAAHAETEKRLSFDELYSGGGALGLRFSDKVLSFEGGHVVIRGFMAPPLKADADFFVLTRDWPDNILVVYLAEKERFVQNNTVIEVEGDLEVGSWTDEKTGFVSQLRLRNATFHTL